MFRMPARPSLLWLTLVCSACPPDGDGGGSTGPVATTAPATTVEDGSSSTSTSPTPTTAGPDESTSGSTGSSTGGSTAGTSEGETSSSTGAADGCEFVEFPDAALEAAVREALAQPDGPIAGATLAQLTKLTTSQAGIVDLHGLECATGLVELSFLGSPVVDLAPLSGLSKLRVLSISATDVVDLGPLAGLPALEEFYAHGTKGLSDLTPLAGATALKRLDIAHTAVTDLGPLSGAAALQHLTMYGTAAPDLSPLTGLPIRHLYAKGCGITDIAPLASFPTPKEFDLRENAITDLGALKGAMWDASASCGDVLLWDNPLADAAEPIAQQVCEATQVTIWPFDGCIGNTCLNP